MIIGFKLKIHSFSRPTRVTSGLWDFKIFLTMAVHQNQIVAWDVLDEGVTISHREYISFLNESLRPYIEENFTENRPIILQDNAR
jgi:hypothetical protein